MVFYVVTFTTSFPVLMTYVGIIEGPGATNTQKGYFHRVINGKTMRKVGYRSAV